ncbi:hypothetical protein U91I_00572 [alpha proteobacterium U9-1i]|nr:hypothetical protein U91I_00572 [alpha proteobacterium U9-1i]
MEPRGAHGFQIDRHVADKACPSAARLKVSNGKAQSVRIKCQRGIEFWRANDHAVMANLNPLSWVRRSGHCDG